MQGRAGSTEDTQPTIGVTDSQPHDCESD
jgi:hypothetical protein